MRFITEFELAQNTNSERLVNGFKDNGEFEMGRLIASSFKWNESAFRDQLRQVNFNKWSLEIEAFPMDKWIEFKNLLLGELWSTEVCRQDIIDKLQELESFGKPAGEKI